MWDRFQAKRSNNGSSAFEEPHLYYTAYCNLRMDSLYQYIAAPPPLAFEKLKPAFPSFLRT